MSETGVNLCEPERGTHGDQGGQSADLLKSQRSEASNVDLQG